MYKRRTIIYLCFILGLFSVLSGVYLVINSFKHEVLDEKYIVEQATEFKSENKSLSKGEVSVTKNVKYLSKGNYEITLRINHNQDDESILFSNKSKFTITEVIGDGYELNTDKIIINKDPIRLYSHNTITSDYEMRHDNNTFEISFPNNKVFKYNTITFYIKLVDRDLSIKYNTSKESYYSFTPSAMNDYYNKKTMQSYMIEGSGYIILRNK